MMMTLVTISQASTALMSTWVMARTSMSPMPAQENTRSVRTAPPNSAPVSIATTVASGIRALRSACRTRTRPRDSPLARARRM
jgi:hypothetical protein